MRKRAFKFLSLVMICFSILVGSASARTDSVPVLLFGIGVHIEPFGATLSPIVGGGSTPAVPGSNGADYHNPVFFSRQLQDITSVVSIVEKHSGKLTVQAQTPFTAVAAKAGEKILADLEARGHEIGLHFHEDAHLGKSSENLPAETWCAVMKEEISFIHQAGAKKQTRYWSGGNLYPGLLTAASCASLDVNSDWKNPKTQSTDLRLVGVNPWRPAAGPSELDLSGFAKHDPNGKIIFLPEGKFSQGDFASQRRSQTAGGDAAYFEFLKAQFNNSLQAARADRVNVFHFTVHPGEFRGVSNEQPFSVIDKWLTDVIDPLVKAGKARWATFSEMADAFIAWEKANPGVNPRADQQASASSSTASSTLTMTQASARSPAGYLSFIVNVHDFRHVNESADTLLHLISIFEKYKVRGDFYLTAPMAELYAKQRPDVIARLKETGMTISYHVRPPHPLYIGFDQRLRNLSDSALAQTLRDYETYKLDLATGELFRNQPGGYAYVAQTLGKAPVVVSPVNNDSRIRSAAQKLFAELGAKMTILYHETGTDLNRPFDYRDGLLVRPSDFSITRWALPGKPDAFWWSMLDSPVASDYNPTVFLQKQLSAWKGPRAPFITSLIHEDNFFRQGATPWQSIYYDANNRPLPPPYDLNSPDPSRPRSSENQKAIWDAYEQMVAYAATNLNVVTSEEIVALAKASQNSSAAQLDRAGAPPAAFTLGPDLPNPIRPLLGVNDGPAPAGESKTDLTQQYRQAGVNMIRTHDFYGPMDMSQIFPNQEADPANPASYNFTASDSIFSAIVKGGFEPYLRLGDSWNNVRRITNRANWVKAAVEVVRHFNDPARWGKSPLHYIETWNEPDGRFWVGPREEFFALFADAAKTLKAAFPNLKIGGPGLTPAGFLAPQGQAYAKAFISYMKTNNVPLDFFSWHVYSNDPNDFPNAAKFYRGLLDANGYTATESHISEWNTEYNPERNMTDPTVRTSARASALITAAWIGLQEQNVTISAVYRGNDPSLNAPTWYGIFYADGRPKPAGLAFQFWSQMAAHPLRQQITVSGSTELRALAGHNSLGEITILIANPTEKPSSWQLALPPSMSANHSITLQQITGAGAEIQLSTPTGLSSEIAAYTTQLVTLKSASTLSLNQVQSGLIDRDVTYCTADGVALKMDIYHPTPTSNAPAPVAMYVHGGGWTSGDKRGGAGAIDIPELVARGYLVVSVNYRLAPQYKFPAMIEDVKCAIRFLRANAQKYNLNPNKIGAWGGSAGGHLVSLLGTTDASAGFEGNGGYADQSSRVQAVVDMFGPTDLPALFKNPASAQQVFGTSDKNSEILQRASPVNWVSKDDPPFLILQGEKDDVVPPSQSQEFYDKLIATGVPATLVMVKDAGHGFAPVSGSISPTRQELTKMIGDFFDKYLK